MARAPVSRSPFLRTASGTLQSDPYAIIRKRMDESVTAVLIKLGIVFLLLLTNGYFVAAEFAMVSVRRSRIAALVTDGNKHAQIVMRHLDDMTGFISACQVGVTVASLVLGALGESTIAHLLEPVFVHLPGPLSAVASHGLASAVAIV